MLSRIKFDNTPILYPLTWQETPTTVKETFQTEAGTDEEIIIRRDKLSISCAFKCTDTWVRTFKSFYFKDEFELTQYDPFTNAEETRTVRMTDFSYSLVKDSYKLDVTNGIYDVSFTLEEF